MPLRPSTLVTILCIFIPLILISAFYHRNTPSLNSQLTSQPNNVYDVPEHRSRIVAVGDLHGDIENAQKVLQLAGVVDSAGAWSGDVDVFVQTGDIIDRGDDTIKLFMWMEDLRVQAEQAGGRVLSHLAHIIILNLWASSEWTGDWRYVPQTEIKTFGSVASRQKMLSTGRIGRAWATNYSTTSRLPLHPSLGLPNDDYPPHPSSPFHDLPSPLSHAAFSFVHGGLAPNYGNLTPFPSAINAIGSSLLQKLQGRSQQPPPHPPNPYPGLPSSATREERSLYDTDGPLWYRGWALGNEEVVCKAVDGVLQKTGTRRMIMGHTPDFEKIVSRCDGKIIIIDTGISHAYGGALSALSIEYSLTSLPSSAPGEKKWKEKEVVKALYEGWHDVFVDEEREVYGSI
ncbi:hypothetical protein EW146_g8759 [Bondarzewia mesenterica]|uniref:Calcineurin-like phosphoesterase domain-containing protein n=1 Tax=Bondarzewia mesenterica TaxID=1095465 RepID=A0A4S4LDM7_9AGAM|nr:hypothetical protein EW146_g8759 [Bondarzewia mesenterica]